MLLTCPSCGARHSIEAATNDEAAREVVKLAAGMCSAAVPTIQYLGLFRPAKHSLRWARALSLMRELSGAYHANLIRRRGQKWQIRPEAWVLGLEAVLEARDRGKLWTPLRDHAYLFEVVIGHSERLVGEEERKRDQELRGRPRPGANPDDGPKRLDSEAARQGLEAGWAALGRTRPLQQQETKDERNAP